MSGHPHGPHAVLVLVGACAVRSMNVVVRGAGRLFGLLALPFLGGGGLRSFGATACYPGLWGGSFNVDGATQAFGWRYRVGVAGLVFG